MKKILMTFTLILSALFANAQIATENAKLLDNIYAGVEAGVTTPLNFNSVFPLNSLVGAKLGKEFTPILGFELEGQVFFNDNNVGRWTNTFVKGTNVGLNGTLNLSNLFWGYKGTPRVFEVKTNTGLGWLHKWKSGGDNALLAKTALDLDFNISKSSTISLSPGVYWNIVDYNAPVKFNKNKAQLTLMASYLYYFKTSNGTRHFKTYDVGAMMSEINYLNDELAKKPKEVVRYEKTEITKTITEVVQKEWVVQFAQNSSQLSEEAKNVLDNVKGTVDIVAYASPEGTKEYNQRLSERRAAIIADYLTKRDIKVKSYRGLGCLNETSNRIAIITINN